MQNTDPRRRAPAPPEETNTGAVSLNAHQRACSDRSPPATRARARSRPRPGMNRIRQNVATGTEHNAKQPLYKYP
eukprot:1651701-Pleurochrysis_carterae.AAC.1